MKYLKAMEENNLSFSDLPEDAQTGINEINKSLKGFKLLATRGRKPTPAAFKKLQTLDKWVYYEILDYLHDTDKNDDDMPVDANDVLDALKPNKDDKSIEDNQNEPQPDTLGLQIDAELDALFATGKKEFTIDDVKSQARKTYKEIWDNYEPDDENGIITSKYSFLENQDELFELKLK